MLAHRSRSTARLAQSLAGRPVHSFTSPIQLFLGRPRGRLPWTLPSIDVVRRLFLRLIWRTDHRDMAHLVVIRYLLRRSVYQSVLSVSYLWQILSELSHFVNLT